MDTLPPISPLTDAELDLVTGGRHADIAIASATNVQIVELAIGPVIAANSSSVSLNVITVGSSSAAASVSGNGRH